MRHAHPPEDAGGPELGDVAAVQIVGVVDPDGTGGDIGAIVARAAELVDDGADLVDVDTVAGVPRPLDVRWMARLVRRLVAEGVPVGVTTTSADVVVSVVDAGALVVFDPSGAGLDRFMSRIVGAAGVPYVLGQSIATGVTARPATPEEFRDLALARVRELVEAGVPAELVVLDAGVGQLSHGRQEWDIVDHLHQLGVSGRPVFVDATWEALFASSTRAFDEAPVSDEEDATAIGVCVVAAGANAWGVRVSNVARASAVLGGRSTRSRHRAGTQSR